ncbi:hypothetical protein GQS_04485 [Thermococcus sp. 4557]|uniref:hypothetical protein n=1 Tax=Thermococcus sp. (strain CGMCC 1.5172 / 4557) TaxID=1042877 RepID=UPI000219EB4B|nr:hypothetical protein [Thermococcus sp. 4557]AEK72798.1 hypothetical protein GQS_04485 [Thermococcus sp. 4557]
MKKPYVAFILLLFLVLLVGVGKASLNTSSPSRPLNLRPEEYRGYVYTVSGSTFELPVYICGNASGNVTVEASYLEHLSLERGRVEYDTSSPDSLVDVVRGRFPLRIPLKVGGPSREGGEIRLTLFTRRGETFTGKLKLSKFTVETAPAVNITEITFGDRSRGTVYFHEGEPSTVVYTVMVRNGLDVPIELLNVSYRIPGVSPIGFWVFYTDSITDVPDEVPWSQVRTGVISPGSSAVVAVYMGVSGDVDGFYLKPKFTFKVGSRTISLPGPEYFYVQIGEACAPEG